MSKTLRFLREQDYSIEDVRRVVRELTGEDVPRRTIADLQRQGLVVPEVFAPGGRRGPAYKARYSYANLLHACVIYLLRRRAGFSMPQVRALIAEHGNVLFDGLKANSRTVLIVNRNRQVIIQNDSGDEYDVLSGQIRLPLSQLYAEVKRAIERAA